MSKVIFTADDYGFSDYVDSAVLEAVEKGQINSVAAFANGPNAKDRLRKLFDLQNKPGIQLDIGCHFTITSGGPVHEDTKRIKQLVDGDHFHTYGDLRRNASNKENIKKQLKKELLAQIGVFEDLGIPVTHLSSHHNSLTFLPEYFETLLNVASDKKISVRSFDITPEFRDTLYNWQVRMRLKLDEGMINQDVRAMRDFMKNMEGWYETKRKEFESDGKFFPESPLSINGMNYGPVPPRRVSRLTWKMRSRNKAKKLLKAINKHGTKKIIEYVFHLGHPDVDNNYSFEDENSSDYYPGVDSKYFHGRHLEYLSLDYHLKNQKNKKYHKRWRIKELPQLTNWQNLR